MAPEKIVEPVKIIFFGDLNFNLERKLKLQQRAEVNVALNPFKPKPSLLSFFTPISTA